MLLCVDVWELTASLVVWQVVQVCAEHKKPKKLLKHMMSIKAQSAGERNPPRTLVFANRVRLHAPAVFQLISLPKQRATWLE